jgi:3-oxoacyl-[acyl-carrier-protein] synthase-1
VSAALPSLSAIVAAGARTPLGLDACQTGMLLRAGFASMAPAALGPEGEDVTICRQIAHPETLVSSERVIALGLAALDDTLAQLDGAYPRDARASLYLALDAEPYQAEMIAAALLQRCQRLFAGCKLEVAARGEGGGGLLIASAIDVLGAGRSDVIIVGGVHSDHDPARIARLVEQRRLYSDDNLDAVMPGESAAFVALAPAPRSKQPRALVAGIGNAMAEARPDNDAPAAPARGATAAARQATECLRRQQARAGWILSDAAFEAWRLREWQSVFVRHHDVLGEPYCVESPAQRIGAMGAAAMPLCIALACEGFRRGYAPSPIALVLAGSDSGERSAVVVTSPPRRSA